MTTAQDLQKQFHCCMPLFIALGDKVRLSIVELLSEEAIKAGSSQGAIDFENHAMNVNEITRRTSLSRPAISHHLKILKDAGLVGVRQDGTANRISAGGIHVTKSYTKCIKLFFPDILIDARYPHFFQKCACRKKKSHPAEINVKPVGR